MKIFAFTASIVLLLGLQVPISASTTSSASSFTESESDDYDFGSPSIRDTCTPEQRQAIDIVANEYLWQKSSPGRIDSPTGSQAFKLHGDGFHKLAEEVSNSINFITHAMPRTTPEGETYFQLPSGVRIVLSPTEK